MSTAEPAGRPAGPARSPLPVWHLIHDLGPGGAEHVLVDLAQAAPGAGIEMRVVSMMPLGSHRYPARLREAGVRVDDLALASRWDPRGPRRLARLVRSDPPRVLHSHLKHADLLAGIVAPRLGIPHVSTLHLVEDSVYGVARFKRDLAARRRTRTAVRTVAVSEAVRRWYLGAFPQDPERVVVIPNGIPAPPAPSPEVVAAVRRSFGGGELIAAMVAVMRPGKGHDVLLEAAARPEMSAVRFVLAGDGPEEPRLRARAAELGIADRVVFAGFREDVGTVLAACDLIVHPSLADALPTALIHGLAAGVPAVATDVGGIPEIVTSDAGLLVPPGDAGALAVAISVLAADPQRRLVMGEAARRRFDGAFEAGRWARRLRALYDEAITGSPRQARW